MSSAIAGLIGAAIGALAGVAGALISQHMQARATQERAFQSIKEEAYSSTLRYLLRVQNRRSGAAPEQGFTYITKEWIKELFDDMVEAQSWASSLTIYCSESQRETVKRVSHDLNEVVAHYASGALPQDANEGMSEFRNFYETILACAREDIGESYVG